VTAAATRRVRLPRRARGVLRDRRAVRAVRHLAESAGRTEEGPAARHEADDRGSTAAPTRRCSGTAGRTTCTGSPAGAPLAVPKMLPVISTVTYASQNYRIDKELIQVGVPGL
jgi:hypothetical protein